jgi:hypothetical protein
MSMAAVACRKPQVTSGPITMLLSARKEMTELCVYAFEPGLISPVPGGRGLSANDGRRR